MANRSYLYSTNVIPGSKLNDKECEIIDISEWNYDIPLVYKILLSGNPQTCPSLIWENPENIAIVGDYSQGVDNLKCFFEKIDLPAAQALIQEALEFLGKAENCHQYFVLECGEIFDMTGMPIAAENNRLLADIKSLDYDIETAILSLKLQVTKELTDEILQSIYALGLGNWSNILYYHFSKGLAN